MTDKTFLIMAGGTGGHVFPALATAQKLMKQHDSVIWLGSVGGMEEKVVAKAGIPFYGISIKGIRGKSMLHKLLSPFQIILAITQSLKVLLEVKPDVVLGMGGFASGPGGLAARLLGKPLLIHEQNAVAGLTNRLLAKIATSVMSAFPNAFGGNVKATVTGNPLREDICRLYYQGEKDQGDKGQGDKDQGDKDQGDKDHRDKETMSGRKIRLLVLGGSLGAASLNECIPAAMAKLENNVRPEIWHQTGQNKDQTVIDNYAEVKVKAKVSPFITEMAEAYRWADFVICRAGALTISELCTVGLGAILIPYPFAVDDHQTLNASIMANGGAAWLLPQADLDADTLAEMLKPLLMKKERISILSVAAHKLAQADATERVVSECRRVCYA